MPNLENGVNKISTKFEMIDVLARLEPQHTHTHTTDTDTDTDTPNKFFACTFSPTKNNFSFRAPEIHAVPLLALFESVLHQCE